MTETQLNTVKAVALAVVGLLGTLGVLALPVSDALAAVVPPVVALVGAFLVKRPADSQPGAIVLPDPPSLDAPPPISSPDVPHHNG